MQAAIFGLGPVELIIILVVIIVIFMPTVLPRIIKRFSDTVGSLREMVDEAKETEKREED